MKNIERKTVTVELTYTDEDENIVAKSSSDILDDIQAEHPDKTILIEQINWANGEVKYQVTDKVESVAKKRGKRAA